MVSARCRRSSFSQPMKTPAAAVGCSAPASSCAAPNLVELGARHLEHRFEVARPLRCMLPRAFNETSARRQSQTGSAMACDTRICRPCAAFMIRAVRMIVLPKGVVVARLQTRRRCRPHGLGLVQSSCSCPMSRRRASTCHKADERDGSPSEVRSRCYQVRSAVLEPGQDRQQSERISLWIF